jgi:hypothetical protein
MVVATASLGAAAALISGLTLEARSDRRLSEVATAENVMARMRHASFTDFESIHEGYHDKLFTSRESDGTDSGTSRQLGVNIPLSETLLPGGIDLNGDGEYDGTVAVTDARLLFVDVGGSDKLRLRTALLNQAKMTGLKLEGTRTEDGTARVGFGETLPPPPPPEEEEVVVVEEKPPLEESQVTAKNGGFDGKTAVAILTNHSAEDRKPTSITIAPSDDNLFFESISLGGTTIFTPDAGQKSGTVTIDLDSPVAMSPGEGTLNTGDFFKMDKKKGKVLQAPKDVTITVAFDDGSVATVKVN